MLPVRSLRETDRVPDYCTCGAQLPPDARFCHKCGKPQRDEPLLEPAEVVREQEMAVQKQEEPGPLLPPEMPPEIGFRNWMAVRVGFLAGSLAFVLGLMPVPFAARAVLLTLAGAFSVYLYRRRGGAFLSAGNGARLGWMSGLFCFAVVTLLFTINLVLISIVSHEEGMAAFFQSHFGAMGMSEENIRQVIEVFESPARIAGLLLSMFLIFTGLMALGGALGAKFAQKE